MGDNEINIKVLAKDLASKKLTGIQGAVKSLGSSIKGGLVFAAKAGAAALAAMVTAAAAIGTKALFAASDAQETYSKFATVFQDIGSEAQTMADNLSRSFGLSAAESRKLLGNTGDLLTGFGIATDTAADMSQQVNELAVDLASFTNAQGGAEAVSNALTKALLGEREALKSYGIAINESDLQARLAAKGLDELTGEALRQAKAQVTLELAMSQSKNAIGDFERTSDSFANQMRVAKSRVADLLVSIGGLNKDGTLKPGGLLDTGTKLLGRFVNAIQENEKAIIAFVDKGLEDLSRAFDGVKGAVEFITSGNLTTDFLQFLNTTEDSNMVGFLLDVRDKFFEVKDIVTDFVTDAGTMLITFLNDPTFQTFVAYLRDSFTTVVDNLKESWDQMSPSVSKFIESAKNLITTIAPVVALIVGGLIVAIVETIKVLTKLAGPVFSIAFEAVSTWYNVLNTAYTAMIDFGVGAWNTFTGFVTTVDNAMETTAQSIIGFIDSAVNIFKTAKSKITGGASEAFSAVGSVVTGVFDGVTNGIKGTVNWLIDQLNGLIGKYNSIRGNINKAPGVNLPEIKPIDKFAAGGSFITNGAQNIRVGDNSGGRELVEITPLSSPNLRGPVGKGKTMQQINNFYGYTREEIQKVIFQEARLNY